ncbi:serine hydrolase [Sulfobacillus harzensis]|uniref:serine hydrolase n=1 Tax=Sulfobacillus harzensis TaxID=2729629 RepID=UPI001A9B6C9B|nr:serine hydrolase [Sulfobacillus harzensis]
MDAHRVYRVVAEQGARGFSGAVLVQQGADVVLAQGFGLANRSEGIPNETETRFGIASEPSSSPPLPLINWSTPDN